jgi:hypothetical protein
MPELPPRIKNETLVHAARKRDQMSRGERLPETSYEFLAYGTECMVIGNPNSPKKVIAYSVDYLSGKSEKEREKGERQEVWRAKKIFYIHRILSTLFPHNFPKIHLVKAPKTKEDFLLSVRQKIFGETAVSGEDFTIDHFDDVTFTEQLKYILFGTVIERKPKEGHQYKTDIKYPFTKVVHALGEMGIYLPFDRFHKNFMIGEDGGVYYVDTLRELLALDFNQNAVVKYMMKKGYDKHQVGIVVNSIKKLQGMDTLQAFFG